MRAPILGWGAMTEWDGKVQKKKCFSEKGWGCQGNM